MSSVDCGKCGQPFSYDAGGRGRPRKYCDDCRRIDTRRRASAPDAAASIACSECGNDFHTRSPASAKYCSSSCKWTARKRKDGIPCEVCGEPTGWTRASGKTQVTHKHCSRSGCGHPWTYKKHGCRCDLCRRAWSQYNAKYQKAARARARKPRDCDQCGTSFIPRSNQIRCSAACMRAWRAANHAKRRGVSDAGPIDPMEIYERDGWICALCELPVDPTETYPSPGYPTLDHITPISLGGKHAAENLQLAHFYCNSVKGNRVEATAC